MYVCVSAMCVCVCVCACDVCVPQQQLEEQVESLKASLQEKEDRYNKMFKTLKAARTRIDVLKAEKDQVCIQYIS